MDRVTSVMLLSLCIGCAAAKDVFEMRFENFSCTSEDPSGLVTTMSCGLNKNAKRRSLNMELEFKQDVPRFLLNIVILLPRARSDFVLLNLTHLEGCNMLSSKNQVVLVQLSRASLDPYSNLPKHCPFLKNRRYYIRGYRFNVETIPAFRFETDTVVHFDVIVDGQKVVRGYIKTHVGLKSSKKDRN